HAAAHRTRSLVCEKLWYPSRSAHPGAHRSGSAAPIECVLSGGTSRQDEDSAAFIVYEGLYLAGTCASHRRALCANAAAAAIRLENSGRFLQNYQGRFPRIKNICELR